MNDAFLNDDFLLASEPARRLYHDHAAAMPIFDFHSHLPASDLAADAAYANLTQAWLGADHYKWRAMRTCGVGEWAITGAASDEEKFAAWARTVPKLVRNPLYVWTHLELRRYFGVTERLCPESAGRIYAHCSALLATPEFSARQLLRRMNVEAVFTTDDPTDDLSSHGALAADGFGVRVLPTFRADRAFASADPVAYGAYLDRLGAATGREIVTYRDLIEGLGERHASFHAVGCRSSDRAIEVPLVIPAPESAAAGAFERVRAGQGLTLHEQWLLATAVLLELGRMDHERGWVQQLHVGALRNPNARRLAELGPDTGYDAIGDAGWGRGLAALLDALDRERRLPKTILYNLNPAETEVFAALAGSFQDGGTPGKVQLGAAWWFSAQLSGITRQLDAVSNIGVLSRCVGMVTDSRSLLSYPRHELFRRTLCQLLGEDVELGAAPFDLELLGGLVRDVSYSNAAAFFALGAG